MEIKIRERYIQGLLKEDGLMALYATTTDRDGCKFAARAKLVTVNTFDEIVKRVEESSDFLGWIGEDRLNEVLAEIKL